MTDNNSSPKSLSASAILKLLRSLGPGSKITLQPEHIAAFDAALSALVFQQQVNQLTINVNQPDRLTRSAPHVKTSDPKNTASPNKNQSTNPAPVLKRPTEGSGSLWTHEEVARLKAQWERNDPIGQIAEAHKRSSAACFSRLIRTGVVKTSNESAAAMHLIKNQQLVSKDNQSEWLTKALTFGFNADQDKNIATARPPSP